MKSSQYIKRIIAIAIWIPVYFPVYGQFVNDPKKSGDHYYAKGDYYSAAQYYEKYMTSKGVSAVKYEPYLVQHQGKKESGKKESRTELLFRLGESYRQLNDHTHAEQWYAALLLEDAKTYPLARYHYGVSLRANAKYAEAQKQLEQFIKEYSHDDNNLKLAKKELANLQFIQQQLAKPAEGYSTAKIAVTHTTAGADYAAVSTPDNKIVFTSTVSGSSEDMNWNALYTANLQDGKLSGVEKISLPATEKTHDGSATLAPDGKRLFFTRMLQDDKGKRLVIYSSEKSKDGWSAPAALSNNINIPGADSKQPHITSDGKYVLFASNRAGGKGGFDIWYAPLSSRGVPGKAVAISSINTSDDDEAPYYHAVDSTLVFASQGRVGMGGFDLFSSQGMIGSAFSEPVNLGYPVNSVKDDIYFSSKTDQLLEDVLISSDRNALCCLELYSVQKKMEQPQPVAIVDPSPVVPATDPFKGKKKLVTQDIYFAFNKTVIAPESYSYLDEMASYLNENPSINVEISAHTDGMGTKEYNLNLSEARARSVADYIISKGVAAERLVSVGKGECCPIAQERANGKDNPDARQKNRRVEFRILE